MSTQKRPIYAPITGFVIVMLVAGMLYAPSALASASTGTGISVQGIADTNGKGSTTDNGKISVQGIANTNGKSNTKGNGDENDNGNGGTKDKDNKCSGHKYEGECDHKKPEIAITNLHVNHITGLVTISGKASDNPGGTGIKFVRLSIDGKHFVVVSTHAGPWIYSVTLKAKHDTIMAQAVDNAHNIARANVAFTI